MMDWTLLLPGVSLLLYAAWCIWFERSDPRNGHPIYGRRRFWGMRHRRF